MKINKVILGLWSIGLGIVLILAWASTSIEPIEIRQSYISHNEKRTITLSYPTGGYYNFVYTLVLGVSALIVVTCEGLEKKLFFRVIVYSALLTLIVAIIVGVYEAKGLGFGLSSRKLLFNFEEFWSTLLIGWGCIGILMLFYYGAKLLNSN